MSSDIIVSVSLRQSEVSILTGLMWFTCTSWHITLQHKPLHNVTLDVLFCLAQVFICLESFLRSLLHPRMDDRRKRMGGLTCLTNVGVEAEEPNSKVSALVEAALHTSSTYHLYLDLSLAVLQGQDECIGHSTCKLCPCWELSSTALCCLGL